ncbi:hypothetical protein CYMTET_24987 [Cymbomonas tetramitiformis]|uniref:Cyclic nucleotide-binding domain-containing protein n=1 Tax=Cymbomonas tetramitiformis TaxID=36881 RepID=A0AAE0FUP4_9CHLO|nr:hypothetical protein CYMTET_24987 [Cymbomonas tetramitiformis]
MAARPLPVLGCVVRLLGSVRNLIGAHCDGGGWRSECLQCGSVGEGSRGGVVPSQYYEGFGKYNIETEGTIIEQYLISFYWITASLSTSGLIGGMLPKNYVEMLFTCVVMFVQLTLFKYVLGEISNLVMEQDTHLVEARSAIFQMTAFIEHRKLPLELSGEISNFMDTTGTNSKSGGGKEEEDIFSLLSRSLQVDVAKYICRSQLDNVDMFTMCKPNFLDGISVMLRETTFPPETYIYHVNQVSREMYILSSGLVELTTKTEADGETVNTVITPGRVIGEVSFLFGMRQTTNARTGAMLCIAFTLLKAAFSQMIKLYPEEEEHIIKLVLTSWQEQYEVKSDGASSTGSESNASSFASQATAVDDLNTVKKVLEHAKLKKKNEKARPSPLLNEIRITPPSRSGTRARACTGRSFHRPAQGTIVALVEAASKNDFKDVDRILGSEDLTVDDGDYDQRRAIHLAACEGHVEMIVKLVEEYGADVNVEDRLGGTPAADALRHGQSAALAKLLQYKASLNLEDEAGKICEAAANGDVKMLEQLVMCGVDPEISDYDSRTALINLDPVDRKEGTPLQDAVRHKHKEVQDVLTAAGATFGSLDIAAQLCEAAATNNVEILQTLYNCGADLNSADYDKRTAMHLAASNGCIEALSWMLQKDGIDTNPVDRLGGTPLDDAHRHEQELMILMLERNGAVRRGHPSLQVKMEKAKRQREMMIVERDIKRIQETSQNSPELQLKQVCKKWVAAATKQVQPVFDQMCELFILLGQLLDGHMQPESQWGLVQASQQKAMLSIGNNALALIKQLMKRNGGKTRTHKERQRLLLSSEMLQSRMFKLFCPELDKVGEARDGLLESLHADLSQVMYEYPAHECFDESAITITC